MHSRITGNLVFCSKRFAPALGVLVAIASAVGLRAESAESRSTADDPYIWLEDVGGDKVLNWVKEQNAVSTRELEARPEFEKIRSRLLAIMDSKERIPYISKSGKWYYNFWRDEKNPRGIWRRVTLEEYRKPEPKWELVL